MNVWQKMYPQEFSEVISATPPRLMSPQRELRRAQVPMPQVVDDVLHPGEVGVASRRRAVLPALVLAQQLAAPVADVEGRGCQDEVGLEVRMAVVVEAVAM